MQFLNWLHGLMEQGLGHATNRWYGIYRAVVTDNKDPDGEGKVKAMCPQVGQTAAPDRWIWPSYPGAGNQRGMLFVPEVDDTVWVSFFEGDPNFPEVYFGGWYGSPEDDKSDVASTLAPKKDAAPEKKGWTTRAGHSLIFNDESGKESVTILWNKPAATDDAVNDRTKTAALNPDANALMSFDKNGNFFVKTPSSYVFQIDDANKSVQIVSPNGSMINIGDDDSINLIHKSGANISMGDSAINISADTTTQMNVNLSGQNLNLNGGAILLGKMAVDFSVMGLKLIRWLATHTHGTGVGPSSPPLIPPTPADFLSKTVKLQG